MAYEQAKYGDGWWCLVVKLCPTLCSPMGCSLLCSSAHGISQARILGWVAISFSRASSQPRDQTQVSCLADRFFTTEPSGKLPNRVIEPPKGFYQGEYLIVFVFWEINSGIINCRLFTWNGGVWETRKRVIREIWESSKGVMVVGLSMVMAERWREESNLRDRARQTCWLTKWLIVKGERGLEWHPGGVLYLWLWPYIASLSGKNTSEHYLYTTRHQHHCYVWKTTPSGGGHRSCQEITLTFSANE